MFFQNTRLPSQPTNSHVNRVRGGFVNACTMIVERVGGILLPQSAHGARRFPPKPAALALSPVARSGRLRFLMLLHKTARVNRNVVELSSMERVGGIDRSSLPSGDSGRGLRSTATGSRPRPFDSQVQQNFSFKKGIMVIQQMMERVGGIEPPTKPWEGLVLPLNHTRRRFAVYGVLAVFASILFFGSPVRAQETPAPVTPYHFDESLISSGWTLRLSGGGNLTVFQGVLPNPADVSWLVSTDAVPALPEKVTQSGLMYRVTITGATTLNTEKYKLAAALPDTQSYWSKSIWLYDISTKSWTKLSSKINSKSGKWQAGFSSLDGYVTVLEDRTTQVGIASWYCRKSCSQRYPLLHGTSNDFSVGTKVKVTNVDNGKSVTVKIISKWGQPAGRVVDLSGAAYDVLKAKNTGVTKVTVSSVLATATPIVTTTADVSSTLTAESYPALTPKNATSTLAPKVGALAYSVVDAATGTVLAETNSDAPMPIASLTKLMTAMVWLDTNPDLKTIITYTKADVTAYAYLRVKPSETLTTKDLFYSTIVGSANNAATALARSTGLSRADFVAKMNAKAASWGLHDTTFVDVNGLNPLNISSSSDMAVISGHAFHDYPLLKKASLTTVYNFRTINTKIAHSIKTTDKLLLTPGMLNITGNKTGYLDEAKYTYTLRVQNAQGAHVVVVVYGEPTSAARFSDAAKLATWALGAFTWS